MRACATLVMVLWTLLALAGCNACQDSSALATLAAKSGLVDRDFKASQRDWKTAEIGGEYNVGDAIRTRAAAGAELKLDDGSHLKLKERTTIRFEERAPDSKEQALSIVTGEALLEAAQDGSVLRTATGLARIEGKGRVLLKRTDEGLRFQVRVGKAILESKDGKKTELEEGDAFVIGVGDAVIEPQADEQKPEEPAKEEVEEEVLTGPISAQIKGNGVSVRAPGTDAFKKLTEGAQSLPSGTSVRVRAGSSVDVSRGKSSATLRGNGSYRVGGESGALVEADSGSFSLSSNARTRFVVPGGVIVTSPGANADVKSGGKKGTEVKVNAGRVDLQAGDETASVSAGQAANFTPGGGIAVQGKGLGYADISIDAGQSVVVHDPGPPTAIRVRFAGNCSSGGVLRSTSKGQKQFAGGEGSVSLPFKSGTHNYNLHCVSDGGEEAKPAASGTLTILHDSGTRPMPKKPPSTGVLADGRTYTVLYQHQLPAVSIRWPKAPAAGSFVLRHKSSRGQRSYNTGQAAYGFRAGALQEGRHTFYFEGGGKVSRQTHVLIRFDNAAPTASLKTPGRLDVKQGGEVAIAGTAQPGWSVDVNGKKLSQDGQQRFSSKVEMPTNQRALEVRLTHPQRGTHIYVRRAAGAE